MSRIGSSSSGKVTSTDFDIRDLDSSTDSITIQGGNQIDVNVSLDDEEVEIASPTNIEGGKVTVGTTEVEITFSGTTRAVSLQSSADNTGTIYIGKTGVQNDGTNATKELQPGQSIDFDYNDSTNAIYAISDTAAQTLYKLATL